MSKNRKSRTSSFSLGKDNKAKELPTPDEINKTVAKATNQKTELKKEEEEKVKRIPFTTALTPENRAMLETASHLGRGSVADILNTAIEQYFKEVAPVSNPEMYKIFLKIYQAKAK